jgi:hypothetical protein
MIAAQPLNELWELRKAIWRNGMRPVCVRTWPQLLKFPTLKGWGDHARRDPPYPAVALPPDPKFQSTGILTDGLQPIDIDLRDKDACYAVADWCLRHLGDAPIRFRRNSARMLLLYRALAGSPHKAKSWEPGVDGSKGQGIEVLGHGLQFLAYGHHDSGAEIEWLQNCGPHNTSKQNLVAISTEQVDDLLRWSTQFLDPTRAVIRRTSSAQQAAPRRVVNSAMPVPSYIGNTVRWRTSDIQAALDSIPNVAVDYDWWLSIMMAVYVASHGDLAGYKLFCDWSSRNAADDPKITAATWDAVSRNPPTRITGHTLVRYARLSNGGVWTKPSRRLAVLPTFYNKDPLT